MWTLKASIQGLIRIRDAREQRNLPMDDPKWLLEASKVIEPNVDWEREEYFANEVFADGVSESTFKRFLYRTRIKARAFQAFCQVLGVNWKEVVEQDNENPAEFPFYIKRKNRENLECIEDRCYKEIQKTGALVRIKAPEKMGKTSLLEYVLDFSRTLGYHTVKLDFRLADFSDYETLLKWICLRVSESLELEENLDNYWKERYTTNDNCTRYFQNYLLSNIKNPLVFGLDSMDLIFEQPPEVANNFTKLIRYWNDEARSTNNNISELWRKIRLVIVHSTEVYREMDINSSPLAGVGLVVELPEFQPEQVLFLAQQHGLDWNASDIERLMTLTGGNPALVNIALDSAKQQNLSVEEILKLATTEAGVFRNYLGRQLLNLRKSPELASAFLLCVSDQEPVEIDSQIAFKLHAMGLVKLRRNYVIPSCNLYRQYFISRLA